jgi:hypothetical protein
MMDKTAIKVRIYNIKKSYPQASPKMENVENIFSPELSTICGKLCANFSQGQQYIDFCPPDLPSGGFFLLIREDKNIDREPL